MSSLKWIAEMLFINTEIHDTQTAITSRKNVNKCFILCTSFELAEMYSYNLLMPMFLILIDGL